MSAPPDADGVCHGDGDMSGVRRPRSRRSFYRVWVLISMGVAIFDNCDLEAVSQAAHQRKRWEFLLTAAPLAVPGGTGSPLNAIATF